MTYFLSPLIFFPFFLSFGLLAEESVNAFSIEQAKAHYSFEIIKHIEWPNEAKTDHCIITILDGDQALLEAFSNENINKSIRGKQITINSIFNFKPADKNIYDANISETDFSVIFVTKKHLSSISTINKIFSHSLIISDGAVNKENQLTSLVSKIKSNKIEFDIELNRENLISRGFQISNTLLNFAGTKKDLSEQLYEKEINLQKLINEFKLKEAKLADLSHTLIEHNKELEQTQIELTKKKNELLIKTNNLIDSQTRLDKVQKEQKMAQSEIIKNKEIIHRQQQLITQRQVEQLAEQNYQEEKLSTLKSHILENETLLAAQLREIVRKNNLINKKEQTISSQRLLLYIALFIVLIFLLIKYFLLRLIGKNRIKNKELLAMNDQLYQLATTDSMTKLFNRRHFMESAQLQISQIQRNKFHSAILMMDIDNFKVINDTYGHAMGDQVIVYVANVLKEKLREYDIVGRVGGEEFAMYLNNIELAKASQIAERLRQNIEELSVDYQDVSINLTISIGLTPVSQLDSDIHAVLQRADKALYKAKNAGRNKVVLL